VCLAALGTLASAPASAVEPADGAVVESDACEPAAAAAAPATTDDLYDLAPLAATDPDYAALHAAYRKRQWATVARLSGPLLDGSRRLAVRQAAAMLAALALQAQRRDAEADRAWQPLAQSGPLAQRARRALAELALRRKDHAEALAQWAAIAPWHVARDEASLHMAALELQHGNVGPAREALERVDPARLGQDLRARWLLLSGDLAARNGRSADAVRAWRDGWSLDRGADSDLAAARLATADATPTAADRIERILRRTEVRPGQIHAWLREADAATEDGSGLRLYVRGALAVRDKKTRADAVPLLRKAFGQLDDPLLKARAQFALGDALGKTGHDAQAIAELNALVAGLAALASPAATELHARTLARLHRLYNNVGQPEEATKALLRLLDHHPDAQDRELAVWGLGWQRFLGGDYAKALESFVQLERDHGNLWTGARQPWRAKAIYWQARCLQQLGQTEPALDAWATVANTWPQTYYGILALDRIGEIDADRAERLLGPPPSAAGELPAPSLDRLRVERAPALDEAALLVRMGLHAEARALLREQLNRGLPRDGVHLLAVLFEVDGNRSMAHGVMDRHTRRAARPDDSTAHIWRQSFPRAYFDEADAAAQAAGIPRSLLYAIMRHESAYVATTQSKAGAYGLVQLLPSVAKNVADLHGVPYGGAGSLLRPGTNLQLGALYLGQLLSLYKGNTMLVAAGYNAGPYAGRDWIQKKPDVPTDVFVESIPYPATRAYVMQVVASAQTYAWLHPEWAELRRDGLGRAARLPAGFGPFMQRPSAPPLSAQACWPLSR